MKARSGRLGDFVITVILLLLGSGLIYGNLVILEVGKHIMTALEMPFVSIALGTLLILSVLLRWLGGIGKKKEDFINFKSEDGSVGISIKAIHDFIERVGKEFSAIKSINSTLIRVGDGIDIALNVRVLSGNKIPELSQALQCRVRESVRESLGLEEVRNITIKVTEIIGDPARSPSKEIVPSDYEVENREQPYEA